MQASVRLAHDLKTDFEGVSHQIYQLKLNLAEINEFKSQIGAAYEHELETIKH